MTTISLRTCYHEAGHAVMALLVGAKIESVSVVPRSDSRGRTIADSSTAFGHVMIAAAGSIAEVMGFGNDDNRTDLDYVSVCAMTGGIDYAEYQRCARWMLGMHWHAVKAVAAALSTKYVMSGDDVSACVGKLEPNMFARKK